MSELRCRVCGGPMEIHACMRGYAYFHCKANPNPGGPTRLLNAALKAQRKHYTASCVEVSVSSLKEIVVNGV